MGRNIVAFALLGMLCLTGCTVGPDFLRPCSPQLERWYRSGEIVDAEERQDLALWWTQFEDPALNYLVYRSLENNLSLREAALRIVEVRARRGVVKSQLFPQISATPSFSTKKTSPNANQFIGRPDLLDGFDIYSAGLDAAWQIDMFGKIRRAIEATDAEISMEIQGYRDVLITLLADVASTYTNIRTLQARLDIAHINLAMQQETLQAVQERQRAGLVSGLDVAQAESIAHTTEAEIPLIDQQLQVSLHQLAVLLGETPNQQLVDYVDHGPLPQAPDALFVGVPADLLRRRPDLRQAEFAVAAENARIGVAVADLYPQFSLPGSVTVDSRDFSNWFTSQSLAYSVGPSVRWNIFSFGRVVNSIRAQEAKHQQTVVRYRAAVLSAVQEVEDSLVLYHREKERVASLEEAVQSNRDAVRYSQDVYQQGLIPFQTVVDSQRQLLLTESLLAISRGNVLLGAIRTYAAAGGGWDTTLSSLPVPSFETELVVPAETLPTTPDTVPVPVDDEGAELPAARLPAAPSDPTGTNDPRSAVPSDPIQGQDKTNASDSAGRSYHLPLAAADSFYEPVLQRTKVVSAESATR